MDAIAAAAAYNLKLSPTRVSEDLTALKTWMIDKYGVSAVQATNDEDAIRALVSVEDEPILDFPFFYAFGRQLRKLLSRYGGGNPMCLEASLLVATWKSRGLTEATLEKIKSDVFTIADPV